MLIFVLQFLQLTICAWVVFGPLLMWPHGHVQCQIFVGLPCLIRRLVFLFCILRTNILHRGQYFIGPLLFAFSSKGLLQCWHINWIFRLIPRFLSAYLYVFRVVLPIYTAASNCCFACLW